MEKIIIDAFNLMHRVSELGFLLKQSQDALVDTMVSKLHGHFFNTKVKVILVFDGLGKNKSFKNIEVKFSKTEAANNYESADAYIKEMISKARNPKLVKIISSDKEISWYAKECGCRTQTSESFWGEIKNKRVQQLEDEADSKEKPEHVTKSEFEFFIKQFNKK